MVKVGDKLRFKKFDWVITEVRKSPQGVVYYRYSVRRRYFGRKIALKYTDKTYDVFPWRWQFLKEQLNKNPNYHYNMHLWSGHPR
jgi:hypothetical protein